jgi:hypothetical protein
MKLQHLHEFTKPPKLTATGESERYEKLKKMLAAGAGGVTQKMVDGAKASADSLWDLEFKAKEKHLIDVHGAEWWELARKQYPLKQENGMYVVRSKFAKDPNAGVRGPWEYDNEGQAKEKVIQLVKWLDGGRKKGHGDVDSDIAKWVAALDAVDKAKQHEAV